MLGIKKNEDKVGSNITIEEVASIYGFGSEPMMEKKENVIAYGNQRSFAKLERPAFSYTNNIARLPLKVLCTIVP